MKLQVPATHARQSACPGGGAVRHRLLAPAPPGVGARAASVRTGIAQVDSASPAHYVFCASALQIFALAHYVVMRNRNEL